MSRIQVLPDQIANKIAAGEVVERPASVVKELMENALDAGATQIEIEIKGGGRARIAVSDNGSGMSHDEARLAFERHATSKISDLEDIYQIKTLGFRGEALPSIASIAEVELRTSEKGAPSGTRIKIKAGKVLAHEAAPPEEGTRIVVSNLFFNTPARRKFLKTEKTELKQIVSTVVLAALAHLKVGFKLKEEDRVLFDVSRQSELKERMALLLGKEFSAGTVPVLEKKNGLRVHGLVGKPALSRANRLSQYFFVNGRPVQSKNLSFALYRAYDNLLMTQRYPVGLIYIELSPDLVDVNIHPTKKEVRFYDEKQVTDLMVRGIRNALSQTTFTPAIKQSQLGEQNKKAVQPEESAETPSFLKPGSLSSKLQESIVSYSEKEKSGVPEKLMESLKGDSVVRVLGVIQETYIVCESAKGLLLIDQHAAHERLLFEKILLDFQSADTEVQQLLLPETIELTASEAALLEPFIPFLNKVGLSIASFGNQSFVVDALPVYFKNPSVTRLVQEMAGEIEQSGGVRSAEKTREKLAALMSCKAAVKAGDKLKQEEMENLASRAFLNLQNKTCPHGRPVMIQMSGDDLARQFKRK